MPAYDTCEVWFLTGSQSLYGDDTLRQVAEQSRHVAAALDASADLPVRVVWKPVLTTSEEIRRTCVEASAHDRCVGVITWMHTFSPAKMWIAGLGALRVPLLHLHTQANESLPWGEIDMDFMNLNQAAHGDREFGYIETRMSLARVTVVGHVNDPQVTDRIGAWVRAAVARAEAERLTLVRFGDNMREVAVTEGDKVGAQLALGVSVNTHSINDLTAVIEDVTDSDIDTLTAEYEDTYRIAPELRRGADRHHALRDAAAIEIGLRNFLDHLGARAFTTTFEDLGALPQLPGIAVQRLMADGYGFGAEGDWKTAALLRIIKVMGAGRPGGTSFMEDYTYHFGPGRPKILGAHMLEVCPSIADDTPSCEIHPLSIGGAQDPVRLVFTAATGPGFVVGVSDLGERLRFVANTIDIVAPDEPLPRLPVARAVWEPRPDLRVSAECWLTAGGPHHSVLSTAVDLRSLEDLATMTGIELLIIDEHTTPRRFGHELRCNQVYHRLARGL